MGEDRSARSKIAMIGRRALLASLPAIAAGAAVPVVASAAEHPDAALLRLGEQFEAAWAPERRAWELPEAEFDGEELTLAAQALNEATTALVARIEEMPATSFEGLRVKARAYFWCHCGDPTDMLLDDQQTTDIRLAQSILSDLLGFTIKS